MRLSGGAVQIDWKRVRKLTLAGHNGDSKIRRCWSEWIPRDFDSSGSVSSFSKVCEVPSCVTFWELLFSSLRECLHEALPRSPWFTPTFGLGKCSYLWLCNLVLEVLTPDSVIIASWNCSYAPHQKRIALGSVNTCKAWSYCGRHRISSINFIRAVLQLRGIHANPLNHNYSMVFEHVWLFPAVLFHFPMKTPLSTQHWAALSAIPQMAQKLAYLHMMRHHNDTTRFTTVLGSTVL